ncbi:hypothetical protein Clacol_005596 [Clathrus columnatus]|uniref:Glycogen debranching enzyme n=1 Tax=Clathrus columnatus TaxID=1419009 RepID=A0AAV5AF92_9AGAM|nr:hypothetical protein Clacol_005596 [Clathrus columnatus]
MSSDAEMHSNGHTFDKKLSITSEAQLFSSSEEEQATRTPADEGLRFFQSPVSDSEEPIRVYELKLEPDGGPSKDKAYIRLPPVYTPYILRMTLEAGTPASRRAVLKTNFPLDGGLFNRNKLVERKLPDLFSNSIHIDIPILHAGAFRYWIEYENDACDRVDGREGYFNVDPILRSRSRTPILSGDPQPRPFPGGGIIQADEINLPLDGLVVLTTVSKWMGPITEWQRHFREACDRGYNMLHYTPLQQSGISGSPYSIADQMNFDRNIIGDTSQESSLSEVQKVLKVARDEFGLLSLIDIVLNHTADNTPWLVEHPEAGYSPYNTPHLAPALELDDAIMQFSSTLGKRGLPNIISSQADLETLLQALERELRNNVQLWQYYVLNRSRERDSIALALSSSVIPWDGPEIRGKTIEELANILKSNKYVKGINEYKARYDVHVDSSVAASFVRAAFPDIHDIENLSNMWANIIDVINAPLYEEWEEDTRTILQNIRSRVEYTRLADHGPKLGEINTQSPLVDTYFTRLPRNDVTSKFDPAALALANNGWIWNADPLRNFALLPSKAYLRREVIVWGDCVKLRYGAGPQDNPWLWEYMQNYVVGLARTFDGFRIDNCHSTPLHVGVTFLDAARVVNPNLYICAELFTGNEEMDIHFVSRLGINSLIREAYNGHDPKEFSRLLYRFGVDRSVGSMHGDCLTSIEELPPPTGKGPVRSCIISPLRGSSPHALFFDLTHDNESPLYKRSAEDALSTGALIAFSGSAIGSTKGFDDLYPKLLDLVGEKRLYEVLGIDDTQGIGKAKRILNNLHTQMVLEGYAEGYVHQENDVVALTRLARTGAKFAYGASIEIQSYELDQHPELIQGLPSKLVELQPVTPIEKNEDGHLLSEIVIPDYFPPGSFMIFATQLEGFDPTLDAFCKTGAEEAFSNVSLIELNALLYRSEAEERDATDGKIGTYHIPNCGGLVYAGLEGWMSLLRSIIENNDLGHPLCDHLRSGRWACDYIYTRLENQTELLPGLTKPAQWFREKFSKINDTAPPFLLPKYFAIVVYEGYKAARSAVVEQLASFVSTGYSFVHDLALCSVQMHGLVKTASLEPGRSVSSLAAGLPHFAVSWARCWGRDVFISLRGLFLVTGQYTAAKRHILAFASTLKHGLIPNLLDSVRNPRYNSRDSPWWMLQNIQDYVHFAPEGLKILSEPVKRRFPSDDSFVSWDDPAAYSRTDTLAEIIQEILQRHAMGISFREHNAGPNLDMQMNNEGFNIDITVDWSTGFISGGNHHNCGTWMDKMGESVKARTKGKPGTPRDGAPVEITGLVKSTVRWLSSLVDKDLFPFKGVEAIDPKDDANYTINASLVNRRGIYKDIYGSGRDHEWADYQLRPNYPIAMTVAPELFHPSHALEALRIADRALRGPLGMKTLDPTDWQYRGIYDNSNDSDDPTIAKGFNYHNGPEWMWPLGYFLRAYYLFDTLTGSGKKDRSITLHYLHSLLLPLRKHIQETPWRGLPELTNENGAFCKDSCPTQAWSSSTILDFLHDVYTSEDV